MACITKFLIPASTFILLSCASIGQSGSSNMQLIESGVLSPDNIAAIGVNSQNFNAGIPSSAISSKFLMNYFIFKPYRSFFSYSSKNYGEKISASLLPCPNGANDASSSRAQRRGWLLAKITGQSKLYSRMLNAHKEEADDLIYIGVIKDLSAYNPKNDDYSFGWLFLAAEKSDLCLEVFAGDLLKGGISSGPINISRMEKFEYRK